MKNTQNEPPFYPLVNKFTVLAIMITLAIFQLYYLKSGVNLNHWIPLAWSIIILIGMKLSAPRVPLKQLAIAVTTLLISSIIIDYLMINVSHVYYLIGLVLPPIICVCGFGKYWVKRKYIPIWSNRWG